MIARFRRTFAFLTTFLLVFTGLLFHSLYNDELKIITNILQGTTWIRGASMEATVGSAKSQEENKLILLYTNFFKGPWYLRWNEDYPCHIPRCTFSYNRSLLHLADAVLFHDADMPHEFPKRTRQDQLWVYHSMESPVHSKAKGKRFNGVFNWTMSYRVDSDVFTPYGNFIPLHCNEERQDVKTKTSHAAGKTKLIAWMVSSCHAPSGRTEYARKLADHLPIHIFGKCGNLTCPRTRDETFVTEVCANRLREYKFYLAFENSLCEDYITEKYWGFGIHNGLVPIVLGGANYKKLAIPGSFIHVQNFQTVKQLAKYIKYLDNNDTEYDAFFEWKRHYRLEKPGLMFGCALCEALHSKRRKTRKFYENFDKYWHKNKCYGGIKVT